MKKTKKRVTVLCSGLLLLLGCMVAYAAAGSADDPLVSKSYVDQLVNGLRSELSDSSGKSDTYAVVEVPAGKKLVCNAGTEVILRSGAATAIDSASGGVSDVTAGLDLAGGQNVSTNHHLIIPRTDGRGLAAKANIIVMVKGSYTIQ